LAAALLIATTQLSARAAVPASRQPTSSKAAREDAVKGIPYDKLSDRAKSKVDGVLSHTTLYRRLPTEVIDCDPDLHYFLAQHPEVVANIWEILEISKVSLQRIGPKTYRAADGAGTAGTIEYLYDDADTHVIFSEGVYDGPLFPRKVRGECVMVLRAGYVRETNGRHYVTNRLDLFVRIENFGVEFMAKTFQPIINKCADANFADTTGFLSVLSKSAEGNPAGVERMAAKLKKIDPEVRDKFVDIAGGVYDRLHDEPVASRIPTAHAADAGSANGPLPRR
jgi:hypothetical protein